MNRALAAAMKADEADQADSRSGASPSRDRRGGSVARSRGLQLQLGVDRSSAGTAHGMEPDPETVTRAMAAAMKADEAERKTSSPSRDRRGGSVARSRGLQLQLGVDRSSAGTAHGMEPDPETVTRAMAAAMKADEAERKTSSPSRDRRGGSVARSRGLQLQLGVDRSSAGTAHGMEPDPETVTRAMAAAMKADEAERKTSSPSRDRRGGSVARSRGLQLQLGVDRSSAGTAHGMEPDPETVTRAMAAAMKADEAERKTSSPSRDRRGGSVARSRGLQLQLGVDRSSAGTAHGMEPDPETVTRAMAAATKADEAERKTSSPSRDRRGRSVARSRGLQLQLGVDRSSAGTAHGMEPDPETVTRAMAAAMKADEAERKTSSPSRDRRGGSVARSRGLQLQLGVNRSSAGTAHGMEPDPETVTRAMAAAMKADEAERKTSSPSRDRRGGSVARSRGLQLQLGVDRRSAGTAHGMEPDAETISRAMAAAQAETYTMERPIANRRRRSLLHARNIRVASLAVPSASSAFGCGANPDTVATALSVANTDPPDRPSPMHRRTRMMRGVALSLDVDDASSSASLIGTGAESEGSMAALRNAPPLSTGPISQMGSLSRRREMDLRLEDLHGQARRAPASSQTPPIGSLAVSGTTTVESDGNSDPTMPEDLWYSRETLDGVIPPDESSLSSPDTPGVGGHGTSYNAPTGARRGEDVGAHSVPALWEGAGTIPVTESEEYMTARESETHMDVVGSDSRAAPQEVVDHIPEADEYNDNGLLGVGTAQPEPKEYSFSTTGRLHVS